MSCRQYSTANPYSALPVCIQQALALKPSAYLVLKALAEGVENLVDRHVVVAP